MLKNKELFQMEKEIAWLESKTKYSVLKEVGMHDGQPDILAYVYMHKGCTQYDIAKYLGLSRASVGISLKRMQKSGFIAVSPSETSKRSTCVAITEKGVKTLVKSDMLLDTLVSSKFEGFSEKELEAYWILLKKIRKNMTKSYRRTLEEN